MCAIVEKIKGGEHMKYIRTYSPKLRKTVYKKPTANYTGLMMMIFSATCCSIIYANRPQETNLVSPIPEYSVQAKTIEEPILATPTPTPIIWKTGKATAYSCGDLKTEAEIKMNCPSLFTGEPKTANGTTPIPGKTMACDDANMGKTFYIEGLGERTCTDTGGAIKGPGRFDIYVSDIDEAWKFGRPEVQYYEVK